MLYTQVECMVVNTRLYTEEYVEGEDGEKGVSHPTYH